MGVIRDNVRKNLEYYLTLNHMSQKDFAKELGVSQSAVTNWVTGKNSPNIEIVAQICELFKISVSDLFGINAHHDNTDILTERAVVVFKLLTPEFRGYAVELVEKLLEIQRNQQSEGSSYNFHS